MLLPLLGHLLALLWGPVYFVASHLLCSFLLVFALTLAHRLYKTLLPTSQGLSWLNQIVPGAGLPGVRPIQASQVVLVTGATSGIGLALAKYLHRRGYSVMAAYYNAQESGYQELSRLQEASAAAAATKGAPRLFLLELDVRDEQSISAAYAECSRLLASHKLELYALINNAGLGSLQPFAWLQRSSIRALIETNLLGNLLVTREFLPQLISSRGRLLFVSSGLGFVPGPTYLTYGLTKAAQLYLSRCLNLELRRRHGVQSVAVVPHNFIKSTNICSLNVANNQLAWQELKPEERDQLKGHFQEHLARAKSLELATKRAQAVHDDDHANKQAGKTPTQTKTRNQNQNLAGKLAQLARDTRDCLSGVGSAGSLEESGALECFEAALRLEDPPEQMFAGDRIFQLIVGSLLLSLPSSCLGLLSSSVAPSLYK